MPTTEFHVLLYYYTMLQGSLASNFQRACTGGLATNEYFLLLYYFLYAQPHILRGVEK